MVKTKAAKAVPKMIRRAPTMTLVPALETVLRDADAACRNLSLEADRENKN